MNKMQKQLMPVPAETLCLNSKASAALLGVSVVKFRQWVRKGVILPLTLSLKRNQLFRYDQLKALVEKSTPQAND
jgi:predicted site-specific integrase-resolvase